MWELRTYFGLTFEQLTEMQTNWNTFYNDELEVVSFTIPSEPPYDDGTGFAYWQWATSHFTNIAPYPYPYEEPSVAISNENTVAGYLEYYYWLNYYCDPATGNPNAMSDDNWA